MGETSQIQIKFPLKAQIELEGQTQEVLIHKLNLKGCIIEVSNSVFKVQQHLKIKIPLISENSLIVEDVIIVKTYNKFKEVKKNNKIIVLKDQILYLIELHFKKLQLQNEFALDDFLKKIEKKVSSV